MASSSRRCFSRRTRAGATLVEMALMLPLFLSMAIGAIEFGRALMVEQMVINAAREGGRNAVLPAATSTDVTTIVKNYLATGNIRSSVVLVTVTPTNLTTATSGTQVTVLVQVAYRDVAWLTPWFMKTTTLSSSCTMRHE